MMQSDADQDLALSAAQRLKSFSKRESIRLRVLVPFALAITLLLAAFVYSFYHDQRESQELDGKAAANRVRSLYELELKTSAAIMHTTINAVMQDEKLQTAFLAKDRGTLIERTAPLLKELNKRHQIGHLYFHNPDRSNLLRVHHPDESGDKINRTTLLQAERTGRPASGIERGPIGIFVLRVVVPWHVRGKLIGYLELGKEFKNIARSMHGLLQSDIILAVDKKYIKRAQWEEARRKAGNINSWDQFPSMLVMDKTTPGIPVELASYLSQPMHSERIKQLTILSSHGNTQIIVQPLRDMNGNTLGQLIVLRDITVSVQAANKSIFLVSLACLVVGAALLLFFYLLLGRVEDELLERTAKLEKANVTLLQEITEHKKTTVLLQQAKDEAESANRAKSEFLSRMSHELRTPLNAILGFGQFLEMRSNLAPKDNESVNLILKAGRHLLKLINEVLDITRIETGYIELSREAVSVREVVEQSLHMIQPLAEQKQIKLDKDLSQLNDCYALADEQRLKQVLLNVLSNAVKYNHEDGAINLWCEATTDDRVRIAVRDSGHGIAPEDIKRLFVPFERLNAEKSGIEGTGLGLALSQRLMQAMDGALSVESSPGQGSTFFVDLPPATSPLKQTDSTIAHMSDKKSLGTLATHTVLVIEDNASNCKLIEAIMKQYGNIELMVAIQGGIGLDLARQHIPDLILLDVQLPDIMGDEVLRRLQEDEATKNIPVVVLSADATKPQIEKLLSAGALAYLTKPLDVKQFLQVLDEVLKGSPPQPQKLDGPAVSDMVLTDVSR